MKRYKYTCKLLSDVIISSVTATEGFHESLDYIPGAKFLGIVANQYYDETAPETLDLFHNGKVRFGDAYPCIAAEEPGFPVPFSWYHQKGKNPGEQVPLSLHHNIADEEKNSLGQLQQIRKGYFSNAGHYLVIEQDFTIRSKYNPKELRADDGKMFGYFALPKGSTWVFFVEDDTNRYADKIKEALVGIKRIGRSRSAEYGLIEISCQEALSLEQPNISSSELTLVYALSNLCFYDKYGKNTTNPDAAKLGFPEGEIIWSKSQIRTRLYQTWNRKRHNRDADRMIITKGSVFAVRHNGSVDPKNFESGIGSHRAEGFGRILINPSFLLSGSSEATIKLTKIPKQSAGNHVQDPVIDTPQDALVLNYIKYRKNQQNEVYSLDTVVNSFIKDYGGKFDEISPSQWGTIRAYAKNAANWESLWSLLFNETIGALYRGQSEADWRKNNRRGILCTQINAARVSDRVSLVLKLASEMAKRKSAK